MIEIPPGKLQMIFDEWNDIIKNPEDDEEARDYLHLHHSEHIESWLEENEFENKAIMELLGVLETFIAKYSFYALAIERYYITLYRDGQHLCNATEAREYTYEILHDLMRGEVNSFCERIIK